MRKLLYTFAAFASMLAVAASCQRETPVGSLPDGDLIDVSMNFTVDDGRPATKAISDGLTANKLTFLAYDEKGNYLSQLTPTNAGYENLTSKAGTVNLKVVKGMEYQFVMLATAPSAIGSYYTVDAANKTLAVNYSSIATAQKEDSDFFYYKSGVTTFTASGESKTATLKRPLAQLNVGSTAEDFAVATNSGINTTTMQTGYALTGIPNSLNLLSGAVSVSGSETVITLAPATRPLSDLTVGSYTYKWVSTAYVLVSPDGQNTDVTLNVKMTNTQTPAEDLTPISRSITAVPLKRNYRTNILGNIFSIDAMFNVSVDQNFEATDGGNINVDYIAVNSISELSSKLSENIAKTESQTYVVTKAEATESTTTDIVIPDNTKAASLVFQLNEIATGVNSIVIRDEHPSSGESIQYGNEITLEVPVGFDIDNITVNAPYSHVVVKQGDITTLIASTGGDTVVIANGTKVGTLTVKCGNVRIEKGGKVTSIEKAEGNEEKTLVYLDDLTGWTNIDTERTETLVPVIDGIEIERDAILISGSEATAEARGTNLLNKVKAAPAESKIYVQAAVYQLPGSDPRFTDHQSFTMIGVGGMADMRSNGYGFSLNCTAPAEITIKNFIITNGMSKPNPIYVKDYITLYLDNVVLHNSCGDYAIVLDSGNQVNSGWHSDNAPKVYAKGVTIDAGKKVGLMGIPRSGVSAPEGYVSYAYFYYDKTCVNIDGNVEPQAGAYSTGSNLFVNDEPLPPYTTDGQLAIKDDEGNWQIVTGYKYDESKTANENDVAFTSFFKSQADGTTIYMTPGVYLGTPYSGYNQVLEQNLNFVGYGDGVVLQSPGKEADTQGKSGFEVRSYAASGTPDHHNVGLKNIKVIGGWRKQFNSWSSAMYVRGNLSLMLEDVDLVTYGNVAFEFDASDSFMSDESAYGELILKNVSIPEGKKINVSGAPTTQATVRITYDTACTNISAETFTCQNCDGTKIYINGVELAH